MSPQTSFNARRVLAGILWGASLTSACGVLVHNEVFRRASSIFSLPPSTSGSSLHDTISAILLDPSRSGIVQAGSFFPDWGYGCFSNDAASEDAHWPPFLIAFVKYIKTKYNNNFQDDHVKDLIAFIFAVAAHGSADASWHSLGMSDGIMTTLSKIDFGGDYGAAHSHLDVGGDVVFSHRLAELSKKWINYAWRVPLKDIIAIYKSMGRDVNEIGLGICAYRGLAAMTALVNVGSALYIPYASKSPGMIDMLDNYYLGGVEEMGAGASHCWGNLTRWFENGVEAEGEGWDICDLFKMHSPAAKAKTVIGVPVNTVLTEHRHGYLQGLMNDPTFYKEYQKNLGMVKKVTDSRGTETYVIPNTAVGSPPSTDLRPRSANNKASFGKPTFISTSIPFSNFGAHMSVGTYKTGQLAVSAPIESEFSNQGNNGALYVIDIPSLIGQSKSRGNIHIASPLNKIMAAKSASTTSYNDRFGHASTTWTLTGEDLLAVSAPSSVSFGASPGGRVEIYRGADIITSIHLTGVGISSTGRKQFGTRLLAADVDGDGVEELIVSASRSDTCGFADGQVFVFKLDSRIRGTFKVDDLDPYVLSLPCDEALYTWFGETTAFLPQSKLLAVGAPGKSTVFFYKYNNATFHFDNTFSIAGPTHAGFGGFAMATGVTKDGSEWVAISSPNENVGLLGPQAGKVRVYTVSSSAATLKVEITPSKPEFYGKFGMVLTPDGKGGLYIGSPYAGDERGAVWWADIEAILSQGKSFVSVDELLTGPEAKARFGASIAVIEQGLAVGIPYKGVMEEDGTKRFTGSVALYEKA